MPLSSKHLFLFHIFFTACHLTFLLDHFVISMSKQTLSFVQKLLLTVALISSSSATHALGLGNIEVYSRLGEPLRAQIQLADLPKRLDVSCFKLLRDNENYRPTAFNARLLLREGESGNANLLIKSYQVVNDPIVQLTLVAECEERISREYVLLLDPPQLHPASDSDPTVAAGTFETQTPVVETVSEKLPLSAETRVPAPHAQTVTLKTDKPRKKSAASVIQKSSSTPTPSSITETRAIAATPGSAWLVVSASEYNGADLSEAPLQLQMSMELNEWPVAETPSLSPEAMSDEVTAMANKLTHLESQMIALQKRNAELENRQTEQTHSSNWVSWLLYTAITMVVIALIGAAEWLRRRHSQRQLATEVAMWEELAPAVKQLDMTLQEDLLIPTTKAGNDNTDEAQADSAGPVDFPQQLHGIFRPLDNGNNEAGATVNEDILEQADVFVAHGRSSLAIVLLQDHLRDFADLSPEPWLMLLDLLKREKQAAEYESAKAECNRFFNVAIEDFDNPPLEDHSSIEDYPHVVDQLTQAWGSSRAVPYLDDLIFNRRLEARQGFERNAYLDIVQLRSIANALNFTASLKAKAPAVSIKEAITASETESTKTWTNSNESHLMLDAPLLQSTDTADYLLKDAPACPGLPIDKSKPLEFELDIQKPS